MEHDKLLRMKTVHLVGVDSESESDSTAAALPGYLEPWTAAAVDGRSDGAFEIRDAAGWVVVDFCGSEVLTEDEAGLARRIAACVNLCAGFSTEAIEQYVRGPAAEQAADDSASVAR
jgi:hypothetical protein